MIRLWYSESIDLPVHALEIEAPDGKPARIGKPQVASTDNSEMVTTFASREPGTYVVRWRVISADTHPVWGSFSFSIGAPTPVLPATAGATEGYLRLTIALQAVGRWLHLLGATLLVGSCVVWWWTLAPALLNAGVRRRAWRRIVRIAGAGSIAILLAAPISLIAQMAALSDRWSDVFSLSTLAVAFSGRLGSILILRLFTGLTAWIVCAIMAYRDLPPAGKSLPRLVRLQVGLGMVALLSTSLIGHAISTDPVLLSLILDWLHLTAMAIWVGGLITLGAVLRSLLDPPARGSRNEPLSTVARWQMLARVLPSFSVLAASCVVTLGVTGLYSAVRNVGTFDQLLNTDYGRALLVKLGIVVLVLAVAAINLLALGPAVRVIAAGASPRGSDIWPIFRPLLQIEALALVLILAVVGVLTALEPARQAATVPTPVTIPVTIQSVVDSGPHAVFAANAGTTLVTVAVAPSSQEASQLAVSLNSTENTAVRGSVQVEITPPAGSGLPIVKEPLAPQNDGNYAGSTLLGANGIWNLKVDVIPRLGTHTSFSFELALPLRPGSALLRQADKVFNALHSETMDQVVSAGGPARSTRWEFEAPNRSHYLAFGDIETYRAGTVRWDRHVGGAWQRTTVDPAYVFLWPDATYARLGPDATILGIETVDGHSCSMVSFWTSYPNATFILWIDKHNNLIRRLNLLRPGGFEHDRFSGFNTTPAIVTPDQHIPH